MDLVSDINLENTMALYHPYLSMGFTGGSDDKKSVCSAGDPHLISGSERSPGEGNGKPLQLFLPGKFCGQRSPTGYSSWGHKESDTTEQLHFHIFTIVCRKQAITSEM